MDLIELKNLIWEDEGLKLINSSPYIYIFFELTNIGGKLIIKSAKFYNVFIVYKTTNVMLMYNNMLDTLINTS